MSKQKKMIGIMVGLLLVAGAAVAAYNTGLVSRELVISGLSTANNAGVFTTVNGASQDMRNYKGVGTAMYILHADQQSTDAAFEATLRLQTSHDTVTWVDIAGQTISISGTETSESSAISLTYQAIRRYIRGVIEATSAYSTYTTAGGMTLGYGIVVDGYEGR
jgi:Zn-dependent alcohol dehydrogenase